MAKAIDVANFFVEVVANNPNEDAMTNLRLNKLLYFAQAGSFNILGYDLIDDEFEAWKYGPVVPAVYDEFKVYGRNAITNRTFDRASLTRNEQLYLIDVLRKYSKDSTSALVDKSHYPNSPWDVTYNSIDTPIIAKEDIRQYYGATEKVESFKTPYSEDNYVGFRDKNGVLVLPKELDDAE